MREHVLTLVCADQVGIVYSVAGFLSDRNCNIIDSQQFGDPDASRFFMRVHFSAHDPRTSLRTLQDDFAAIADKYAMSWDIHESEDRCRTLIMVSRFGHCLNDLLYRWRAGVLSADVAAIVSNHADFESLAQTYDVPFYHLPITHENKAKQEDALLDVIAKHAIDLVVLARYMQVLTDRVCTPMNGRIINIHHSFLPSFKGANPHRQAYNHGVKLIGATAHYVTADLDEGPIIEQEIARVDHSYSPDRLAAVGRDLEAAALARAVQAHAEHRVLLNGLKTVVFR